MIGQTDREKKISERLPSCGKEMGPCVITFVESSGGVRFCQNLFFKIGHISKTPTNFFYGYTFYFFRQYLYIP